MAHMTVGKNRCRK